MVAGARFCDAVIGRPLETAHRKVAVWRRRDGVPSRDFERRAPKNLDYFGGRPRIARGARPHPKSKRPLPSLAGDHARRLAYRKALPDFRVVFGVNHQHADAPGSCLHRRPYGGTDRGRSSSRSLCRNASMRSRSRLSEDVPRKPIRATFPTCCARAASGHATAAPPMSVMNSRRFTARCLPCF
jgi:hypothetical protein